MLSVELNPRIDIVLEIQLLKNDSEFSLSRFWDFFTEIRIIGALKLRKTEYSRFWDGNKKHESSWIFRKLLPQFSGYYIF